MNLFLKIFLLYLPLIVLTVILGLTQKKIKWYFWLLAIFSGMIAIVPSVLIQFFMPDFFHFENALYQPFYKTMLKLLLSCLLMNGLIEEFCKSLAIMMILPKKSTFKQFFILCFISGLSFATFESVIYLITGTQKIELRLISTFLIHALCCSMDGIFIWRVFRKHFSPRPILASIITHALFNFFISMPGWYKLFSIAIFLYALAEIAIFWQNYAKNDEENLEVSAQSAQIPKTPRKQKKSAKSEK